MNYKDLEEHELTNVNKEKEVWKMTLEEYNTEADKQIFVVKTGKGKTGKAKTGKERILFVDGISESNFNRFKKMLSSWYDLTEQRTKQTGERKKLFIDNSIQNLLFNESLIDSINKDGIIEFSKDKTPKKIPMIFLTQDKFLIADSLKKADHNDIIIEALEQNKPVPTEVLKDYPELQE